MGFIGEDQNASMGGLQSQIPYEIPHAHSQRICNDFERYQC